MIDALLLLLDLLLALGATLRLTRFIVADDIPGEWWIKDPLHDPKHRWQRNHAQTTGKTHPMTNTPVMVQPEPRWARYLDGLDCPHCIGVWMAALATVSLLLAGGPGEAAHWWRYTAGFLTLAWAAGHVAVRAGDTPEE